jgi:hypothetical protein
MGKTPRCRCICDGRYHGVGNSQIAARRVAVDAREGVWGDKVRTVALGVDAPPPTTYVANDGGPRLTRIIRRIR